MAAHSPWHPASEREKRQRGAKKKEKEKEEEGEKGGVAQMWNQQVGEKSRERTGKMTEKVLRRLTERR